MLSWHTSAKWTLGIKRLNEAEGVDVSYEASWHADYKNSAYVYIGGLDFELTEGDVITIFSQYGEVMDLNMLRDKETGKSRGFAFLKYEDQRSTALAVDNLSGAKVVGRTLRVDHVKDYKQRDFEEGKILTPEERRRVGMNVAPEELVREALGELTDEEEEEERHDDDDEFAEGIDPEDPMRDYLIQQRKEKHKKSLEKQPIKDKHRKHRHRHEHNKAIR